MDGTSEILGNHRSSGVQEQSSWARSCSSLVVSGGAVVAGQALGLLGVRPVATGDGLCGRTLSGCHINPGVTLRLLVRGKDRPVRGGALPGGASAQHGRWHPARHRLLTPARQRARDPGRRLAQLWLFIVARPQARCWAQEGTRRCSPAVSPSTPKSLRSRPTQRHDHPAIESWQRLAVRDIGGLGSSTSARSCQRAPARAHSGQSVTCATAPAQTRHGSSPRLRPSGWRCP